LQPSSQYQASSEKFERLLPMEFPIREGERTDGD